MSVSRDDFSIAFRSALLQRGATQKFSIFSLIIVALIVFFLDVYGFTAVKTARKYANEHYGKHKNEIVAFADAFHGRTMMTIALNGSERMTAGFGPMPQGIKHHPYNEIKGLEKVITKKTAAVVLELVQGEAGIIKAKKRFLARIKKLCKENNTLIILDEVQSGVGRTGTLFAYEQFNICLLYTSPSPRD